MDRPAGTLLMITLEPAGIWSSSSSNAAIARNNTKNHQKRRQKNKERDGNGGTVAGEGVGDQQVEVAADREVGEAEDPGTKIADGDGGAATEVHRLEGCGTPELETHGHSGDGRSKSRGRTKGSMASGRTKKKRERGGGARGSVENKGNGFPLR